MVESLKGFISQLYDNDREVQQIPQGNTFQRQVKYFDGNNICGQLNLIMQFSGAADQLSAEECNALHNNVLTSGIRPTLVTLADLSQSVYIKSNVSSESLMLGIVQLTEFKELLRLETYVRAVVSYQLSVYGSYLTDALASQRTIFLAKFAVFVVVVLLMTLWVWRSLMVRVRSMVNTIKGIVLVLSFRRIESIPSLKEEIVKSRVLQWFA